jgi:hypothetical protein
MTRKTQRLDNVTHCYVGKLKCGCTVVVVADRGDKDTANAVAGFIGSGCTVERMTLGNFRRGLVSNAFGCKCNPKPRERAQQEQSK